MGLPDQTEHSPEGVFLEKKLQTDFVVISEGTIQFILYESNNTPD